MKETLLRVMRRGNVEREPSPRRSVLFLLRGDRLSPAGLGDGGGAGRPNVVEYLSVDLAMPQNGEPEGRIQRLGGDPLCDHPLVAAVEEGGSGRGDELSADTFAATSAVDDDAGDPCVPSTLRPLRRLLQKCRTHVHPIQVAGRHRHARFEDGIVGLERRMMVPNEGDRCRRTCNPELYRTSANKAAPHDDHVGDDHFFEPTWTIAPKPEATVADPPGLRLTSRDPSFSASVVCNDPGLFGHPEGGSG